MLSNCEFQKVARSGIVLCLLLFAVISCSRSAQTRVSMGQTGFTVFLLSEEPSLGPSHVDYLLFRSDVQAPVDFVEPQPGPILDSDILLIASYARDSLWMGRYGEPLTPVTSVKMVDSQRVRVDGDVYYWRRADLAELLRILESPEGTIPIHRISHATGAQESDISLLAHQLRQYIERQPLQR